MTRCLLVKQQPALTARPKSKSRSDFRQREQRVRTLLGDPWRAARACIVALGKRVRRVGFVRVHVVVSDCEPPTISPPGPQAALGRSAAAPGPAMRGPAGLLACAPIRTDGRSALSSPLRHQGRSRYARGFFSSKRLRSIHSPYRRHGRQACLRALRIGGIAIGSPISARALAAVALIAGFGSSSVAMSGATASLAWLLPSPQIAGIRIRLSPPSSVSRNNGTSARSPILAKAVRALTRRNSFSLTTRTRASAEFGSASRMSAFMMRLRSPRSLLTTGTSSSAANRAPSFRVAASLIDATASRRVSSAS
jgi:hypothetical protein